LLLMVAVLACHPLSREVSKCAQIRMKMQN
jgi:hypothetical protein